LTAKVDRLLLKTMRKESPKAQIIGGKAAYFSANALRSRRGDRSTFNETRAARSLPLSSLRQG
jgi:hypothetical protein